MIELLQAIAEMFTRLEGVDPSTSLDEFIQDTASRDESFWFEVGKSDIVELLVTAKAMGLEQVIAQLQNE
jgi:hypothetical protein